MPELPEAETIARVLNQHLRGRKLAGHGMLQRVWRTGKWVVFDFEQDLLIARLGMTGTFRLNAEPGIHTRQVFDFEGTSLLYNDIRKFGRLIWSKPPLSAPPDILAMPGSDFSERLRLRRGPIKSLLLEQNFASGIGNIYADECLFAAGIHPLTSSDQVDGTALHAKIISILREAIEHRGSTISDFFDPMGKPGNYQKHHRVYGRAGLACPRCGTLIVRTVVAARGTHYCPACQPEPPLLQQRKR